MPLAVLACGGTTPTGPSSRAANPAGLAGQRLSNEADPFSVPASVVSGVGAVEGTLLAAGDIALCPGEGTEATAQLLDRLSGTILTLGDAVYPSGTEEQFASCYEPTWGRHRGRTRPAPGNHEWQEEDGAPYFSYFGAAAGPRGLGYYSYDVGSWHVLSLNSNIAAGESSAQYEWIRSDLAIHRARCTIAYWHHPVFSSGQHGNGLRMREIWRLLDQLGVDIVMAGHDHDYERFASQDFSGFPDPNGIREFVVGTGGGPHYGPVAIQANSQVRDDTSWGVLKLTLRTGGYDWDFVPVDGNAFSDSGSDACVD